MATGQEPSDKQLAARSAQSKADRSGNGKAQASELQAEADQSDMRKHGQ